MGGTGLSDRRFAPDASDVAVDRSDSRGFERSDHGHSTYPLPDRRGGLVHQNWWALDLFVLNHSGHLVPCERSRVAGYHADYMQSRMTCPGRKTGFQHTEQDKQKTFSHEC